MNASKKYTENRGQNRFSFCRPPPFFLAGPAGFPWSYKAAFLRGKKGLPIIAALDDLEEHRVQFLLA